MITMKTLEREHGTTTNFLLGNKLIGQQTGEFVTVITEQGVQLRNTIKPDGSKLSMNEILERLEQLCS